MIDRTYKVISKIFGRSMQRSTMQGYNLTSVNSADTANFTFADVQMEQGEIYTISLTAVDWADTHDFYAFNLFVNGVSSLGGARFDTKGERKSFTFTAQSTGTCRFNGYWACVLQDIQIERGSAAHTYEPFIGGTPSPNPYKPEPIQNVTEINISLKRGGEVCKQRTIRPPFPMEGIGGVRDLGDVKTGKWLKPLDRVEITSSTDRYIFSTQEWCVDGRTCQEFRIGDAPASSTILSDMFRSGDPTAEESVRGGGYIWLAIRNSITGASDDNAIVIKQSLLRRWLENHPVTVVTQIKTEPTVALMDKDDLEFLQNFKIHPEEELTITDQNGDELDFELEVKESNIGIEESKVILNKIVVGDEDDPLFIFANDAIRAVNEVKASSAVGDELYIDQFEPTIKYELFIRYVILPKDSNKYGGILSKDGLLVCSKYNYDIRRIPYGTPVRFYNADIPMGLFYVDSVERISKYDFKLNCISSIGLMDRQNHLGGIYPEGIRMEELIADVVGDGFEYTIDAEVKNIRVYGWLPYATRRQNLHQILLANGVVVSHDDTGRLLFTFVNAADTYDIPEDRVFSNGSVVYGDPASRVEVTEHSYYFDENMAYETLFDTGDSEANHTIVTFEKPIEPSTIRVKMVDFDYGTIEIHECGVNYAIVSGEGVIEGKPYVHTTRILANENDGASVVKVVSVEDATLITRANSENCLERLSDYYFNTTKVVEAIRLEDERPGRRYAVKNAFGEPIRGFLSKMEVTTSTFRKAMCEFITDYSPKASINSFSDREIIELTDEEQIWEIPEAVYKKEAHSIRLVLIGAGQNGTDGADGESGGDADRAFGGKGGRGGSGGSGGSGGKVLEVVINCDDLAYIRISKKNGETIVKAGPEMYSSASGTVRVKGYVESFSGAIYARSGYAGYDGASGGTGGVRWGGGQTGQAGYGVEYDGERYAGGSGGGSDNINGANLGISSNLTLQFGGGGGGGAAFGCEGFDGTTGWNQDTLWGKGGNGGNAKAPDKTAQFYGTGGNGGHGGGGGGGAHQVVWWNHVYTALISITSSSPGAGGKGSKGTEGVRGCLLIYY